MFFILGAGASVDSGLKTYRGDNGIYGENDEPEEYLNERHARYYPKSVWNFLAPLYQEIQRNNPGPTYQKIMDLAKIYHNSFILTQNIDGYALSTGLPCVEMHGNFSTMRCSGCGQVAKTDVSGLADYRPDPDYSRLICSCGEFYRPDIVLFGEELDKANVAQIYKRLNEKTRYVVIVGSTLQFPYLRKFINKAKRRGAQVIHINPDADYSKLVRDNELWLKTTAYQGLNTLMDIMH